MDNVKSSRRSSRRPATRRLVQLYSALLYNAHLRGFIEGEIYQGNAKVACVPGLNCYSCPGAVGACPLGALQNALGSARHRAGWYVLGILLLYGVMLGRTVCGWICPAGLIQELLHRVPTHKLRKSRVTRALSWLKYAILAVFAVGIPLWYGISRGLALPAFCKYICPAGTLEGAVGLLANPANASMFGMLGALFTGKFVVMLAVGLACVFCYRAFCRFLCPLGAIYGLFNRFNVIGVKVDEGRCNRCGACVRSCGMDVRRAGDRECINCGRCVDACGQGAISIRAGKIILSALEVGERPDVPKRRAKRVIWSVAVAVLCFALVWFNLLDPYVRKRTELPAEANVEAAPAEATSLENAIAGALIDVAPRDYKQNAPTGYEVGQRLADFTVECLDGSQFHLADARGKIVIINLWATWCAPCVEELPRFVELYEAHPDDIAVLAVHSSLVTDDPTAFLEDREWAMREGKYVVSFALDEGDRVWRAVNGSSTLPQTIVLDREGMVVYNRVGSVTSEMLDALYAETAGEAYTVAVVDQYGTPVPGVRVNFCTDTTCVPAASDENGVVTFAGPPYAYHLQILSVPEGYSFDPDFEAYTEDRYSATTLEITRDQADGG